MARSSLVNPGRQFPIAKFGAVSQGNYAEFLSDGTLRLGLDFHLKTDGLGSRQETVK